MTNPLALYVHWPFCVAKCPYCDFNSHAGGDVDQAAWAGDFVSELHYWRGVLGPRTVASVFFGGGTPSLMDPATVGTVLETVNKIWGLQDNVEVTLEANPSSVETGRFRGYKSAGVNRVSIGVQALDDGALRQLGRVHDAQAARAALDAAARVFDRFSFDLIYARPGQSEMDWERELSQALRLAGEHLSLYQLTIEPGTAFFRNGVAAADENLAVTLYAMTQALTEAAGLPAYEVSNHARPGAESRHNLAYWQGGEYVGIGPGAHGRVIRDGHWAATHQIATPERWCRAVADKGHGTAKVVDLSNEERAEERVMTGLRLTAGLDGASFEAVRPVIDTNALDDLVNGGFLVHDQKGLRPTRDGTLRLNAVIERLLGL